MDSVALGAVQRKSRRWERVRADVANLLFVLAGVAIAYSLFVT